MKSKNFIRKINIGPVLFSLPALLIFLSMIVYPMGFTIFISFFNWRGVGQERTFVGIKNYITILSDPRTWNALTNNIIWMILLLIVPTVLGFLIAILVDKNIKGEWFFKSAFYIPGVISLVAGGIIFSLIFKGQGGLINEILGWFSSDLSIELLNNPTFAIYTTIVAGIWQQTGFCMVLFLAGLRGISIELLEASYIDGANSFGSTRYIVIPLLVPVISIVVIFNILVALKSFDLVYIMTKGGPVNSSEVLGFLMYHTAFTKQLWGEASVLGIIIFILTSIFGIFYVRTISRLEKI